MFELPIFESEKVNPALSTQTEAFSTALKGEAEGSNKTKACVSTLVRQDSAQVLRAREWKQKG